MRHRLLLGLVALIALLALLLVSCAKATPTPTPRPTATPTATPTKAAATPTPTTPTGAMPSGVVVYATHEVGPVCGYRSACPYAGTTIPPGTTDMFFVYDKATDDAMYEHLATSWKVAPDGSKVTLTFRKGVKWQTPVGLRSKYPNGFGEYDATDFVWWLNDANGALNPQSTNPDAGDFAAVFGEARVVDNYTADIDLVTPTFFALPLSEMGPLGAQPWHNSKKVYDALGKDEMNKWWVGTGPYVQAEWIGNERGIVEAVPDHWYYPNDRVQQFVMLQVPEVSSRVAMLKAGTLDMATIDFKLVKSLIDEGYVYLPAMENGYVGISAIFSGNLWETNSARDGSELNPWDSPAYEKDYPWTGAPDAYQGKLKYTDKDNPSGMSDMEQARLVRWALSYAIDREGMVEVLTGGLGTPIYSEYMGYEYPGWDPNRTVTKATVDGYMAAHGYQDYPAYDVASPLASEAWPWKVPYDPNKAKELLKLAGYPAGFEIILNAYVAEAGELSLEIADGVTANWSAIGLKVTQERGDYGGVISPRMRQRTQAFPVCKNGDVHSNVYPLDWPLPPVDSSLSRPGWGVGFESPYLAQMHLKTRASKDRAERQAWHLEVVDWMMYWQLYNGLLQIPKASVARPGKVISWMGRQDHYTNFPTGYSPAFIKLAK